MFEPVFSRRALAIALSLVNITPKYAVELTDYNRHNNVFTMQLVNLHNVEDKLSISVTPFEEEVTFTRNGAKASLRGMHILKKQLATFAKNCLALSSLWSEIRE